jgi:hypothetical protein
LVEFGEHKRQKDQVSVQNPYTEEIEEFDAKISQNDEDQLSALKIPDQAQMHKTLEETPLTYVETEE